MPPNRGIFNDVPSKLWLNPISGTKKEKDQEVHSQGAKRHRRFSWDLGQTEQNAEEEEDGTKEVRVLTGPAPQSDSHLIASLVERWISLRKCQGGRVIANVEEKALRTSIHRKPSAHEGKLNHRQKKTVWCISWRRINDRGYRCQIRRPWPRLLQTARRTNG